jgi:type II secretory pathway component PulF
MLRIARYWGNPAIVTLLLIVLALLVMGGAFKRIVIVRRFWPAFASVDTAMWYLPIMHGMARDRGLADACQTMADAISSGQPLHRAAEEATGLRINTVLKERLTRWRDFLISGMPADQAARSARLPALVCGMIGTGRGDTTRDALRFLAAYYRGKFGRLAELLRGSIIPLLVLGFGAIVLAFIGAMYLPLLAMIDHLLELG